MRVRWYDDAVGLTPGELRSSFAPDIMPDDEVVAEAGLNARHSDAMITVSDFFTARSCVLFHDFVVADRLLVSFEYLDLGKWLCMQFDDDDDDGDCP